MNITYSFWLRYVIWILLLHMCCIMLSYTKLYWTNKSRFVRKHVGMWQTHNCLSWSHQEPHRPQIWEHKKSRREIKISHTLCFNLRSTKGRRTWCSRFMIKRFSSSDSKAYNSIEQVETNCRLNHFWYLDIHKKQRTMTTSITYFIGWVLISILKRFVEPLREVFWRIENVW